ncbi:MAG: carbohydrate kinase family protein [Candidatus Methanomethylicaceae archaeon]
MARKLDVLALGNINVDLSFFVDQMPKADDEVTAMDYSVFSGGSAANFAVGTARLGLKTGIVGCVGEDDFGREAIAALHREEISTDFVAFSKGKNTGTVCVIVDSKGARRMIAYRGANADLGGIVAGGLPEAKVVQLSNVSKDILLIALKKKAGKVALDPGGESKHLKPEDLKGADFLLLNDLECRNITGMGYREGSEVLLRKAGTVVVKLGRRGVFVRSVDTALLEPAFKVDAVDTTGAGDAFDAGFIAGINDNLTPKEASLWGAGEAAIKIMKKGARTGLPTKEELLEFLSDHRVI